MVSSHLRDFPSTVIDCRSCMSTPAIATFGFVLLVLASLTTWLVLGLRLQGGWKPLEAAGGTPPIWPAWLLLLVPAVWILIPTLVLPPEPLPEIPLEPDMAFDENGARRSVAGLAQAQLAILLVLAATLGAIRQKDPRRQRPAAHTPGRQLGLGVVGFLASVIPVAAILWATARLRQPDDTHPLLRLLAISSDPATRQLIIGSAVLLAPLVEELVFRVVIQRSLLRWMPPLVSIGVTAVAFATIHFNAVHPNWPDVLALFPLAIILGVTYHHTGSYLSVVIIHLLFNATNIALALLTGPT